MRRAARSPERVRAPILAGTFYPAAPTELRAALQRLLGAATVPAAPRAPKALIVPHGSLGCCGRVAAAAFRALDGAGSPVRRVVLIGPAHHTTRRDLVAPAARAFSTPLAETRVDAAALAELLSDAVVASGDDLHRREHSLEMVLPFLQLVLGDFELVPLLAGDAAPAAIAAVLERLWGGPETLLVVSSDLARGASASETGARDAATTRGILAGLPRVPAGGACAGAVIDALVAVGSRRGLRARLFGRGDSVDPHGDRRQVVGYGAFGFY